jgi:hypothetical protein
VAGDLVVREPAANHGKPAGFYRFCGVVLSSQS